jgi:GTP pyrophosphokinase
MVKVKEDQHFLSDGTLDVNAWLDHLHLHQQFNNTDLVRRACVLSELAGSEQATESGESCLLQGLHMAEILADLEVDSDTLAAAVVYPSVEYADLSLEDVAEQLGDSIAKMVKGIARMEPLQQAQSPSRAMSQIDNTRKMLLAMVDDARVVLIKLAERLRVLRTISPLSDAFKRQVAQQVMDVYAPLANRLGIGQLKWEMEDLAFRYLEPDRYKEIAKGLQSRRLERESYVREVVAKLEEEIDHAHIKDAEVYGRAKHIHSIFRKMQRKGIDLSQIFDAIAVRVLVDELDDCYTVLSIVHNLWIAIPEEFDDYINNPKPNGYQSLHTAVVGPHDKNFEVQIRTREMHELAELGVAAHWKYKEGVGPQKASHERKIEWLREVLSWQREVIATGNEQAGDLDKDFLEDRIYVFTPAGDIMDLPHGATPLDFAYHVHSEVGHRCRGAKVNGNIVQLSHALETGDQVEILTAKESRPSRDWLSPHLGFLKSSRAKAKVHHWFNQQDYDKHLEIGKNLLDDELKKFDIKFNDFNKIAVKLNFKKGDDMIAALGRNDLKLSQLIHHIQIELPDTEEAKLKILPKGPAKRAPAPRKPKDVHIAGVGNLLTNIAKCCQPVPGDHIIGYITIGRGVSIHRRDCPNILHADERQQERMLDVDWGTGTASTYPVDIQIQGFDRQGLLRDITQQLTLDKANVTSMTTQVNKEDNTVSFHLTLEVSDLNTLSYLLDKLKNITNIFDVHRVK